MKKFISKSVLVLSLCTSIGFVNITKIHGMEGKNQEDSLLSKFSLKYINSSKNFYNNLLKRCKKKFGKPHVWKGDAFGVVYASKWSFADENGNKISMTLQHNS